MQHHKTSLAKQKLVRCRECWRDHESSSDPPPTMGTGVNAQTRLKALHHLDVPWLPKRNRSARRPDRAPGQSERGKSASTPTRPSAAWTPRCGRPTNARPASSLRSWAGDRTIRRMEDLETDQAGQFAMAKAIASGDARLMQKAGLEADIRPLAPPARWRISTISTASAPRSSRPA